MSYHKIKTREIKNPPNINKIIHISLVLDFKFLQKSNTIVLKIVLVNKYYEYSVINDVDYFIVDLSPVLFPIIQACILLEWDFLKLSIPEIFYLQNLPTGNQTS